MSTGVLSVFGTNYATATALNIPCVTEAPFSAISPGAREDLERCIAAVDAVVVTAMPIGQGNIENLRILEDYRNKPIILLNGGTYQIFQDCTEGEAEAIIRGLLERGAVTAGRIEQVLQILKETESTTRTRPGCR